jgi:hypothetical protein
MSAILLTTVQRVKSRTVGLSVGRDDNTHGICGVKDIQLPEKGGYMSPAPPPPAPHYGFMHSSFH